MSDTECGRPIQEVEARRGCGGGLAFDGGEREVLRTLLDLSAPDYLRALAQMMLERDGRRTPERVRTCARILIEDPSPVIRHTAAIMLATFGAVEAIPTLLAAIHTDSSILVRHESLGALGELPLTAASRDALEGALEDPNEDIRETGRIALDYHFRATEEEKRILDREVADAGEMCNTLGDPEVVVLDHSLPTYCRTLAQVLLGRDQNRTPARADLHVRILLDDPSPFVRHGAAVKLARLGATGAVGPLLSAFRCDRSVLVRHEALGALGELDATESSLATLEAAVADGSEDIRATAKIALDYHRRATPAERAILVGKEAASLDPP